MCLPFGLTPPPRIKGAHQISNFSHIHKKFTLNLVRIAYKRSTGNDISGKYFCPYFLFSPPFFPVFYFSHRGSARIKKLFSKVAGVHKNLGVDTFPDPISHFVFCRLPLGGLGCVHYFIIFCTIICWQICV